MCLIKSDYMKKYLLVYITILLYGCNNINVIDWKFDNYQKIKSLEEKLYAGRIQDVDTLCINGFKWGMSEDEVLESVLHNGMSKGIYPNRPTYSNITLFGKKHEVTIEYGFDSTKLLRSIIIHFYKKCDDNKVLDECLKGFGDKCVNVRINKDEGYYLWYYGNQEIKYSYGGLKGKKLMLSDASYLNPIFGFDDSIINILDKVYSRLANKDSSYLNKFEQSISIDEKEWLSRYINDFGNVYIKFSYSENSELPGYIWFDGRQYIEVAGGYLHTYISSRNDILAKNTTYRINQKGKIYVKDTINGNNVINDKATSYYGYPSYFCVTKLDEVSVLDSIKGWVKIRHKKFPQNCGWVLSDYVCLKEKTMEEIAEDRVRFSNYRNSIQISNYGEIYNSDDEYNKSILRERNLRDNNFEREADLEKRDRRNRLKGTSSGYSTDPNYTPTISNKGKYHTIDGKKKQIQYQGSSEQKRDLDMIDEYMRMHPDF